MLSGRRESVEKNDLFHRTLLCGCGAWAGAGAPAGVAHCGHVRPCEVEAPGAASDEEPGETALGILQPNANRPSSKIEKQDLAILLPGPTRTLSFLSRVLLRVSLEFLFAVLTAEIIILTLIL